MKVISNILVVLLLFYIILLLKNIGKILSVKISIITIQELVNKGIKLTWKPINVGTADGFAYNSEFFYSAYRGILTPNQEQDSLNITYPGRI
jgi:hypothetical protein